MKTSEPLRPGGWEQLALPLILLPEGSPASRSLRPAVVEELPILDGAGPGSPTSFAQYDLGTCLWKTSVGSSSSRTHSDVSLVTWPNSGSMRSGACYPRAPLVPHTHVRGCSFWPTPRANGSGSAGGSNARASAIRNGTYVTGKRNPNHVEWLMGFPEGWTETGR